MEELQPEELEELVQELEGEAKAGTRAEAARHLDRAFALEDKDEYEEALEECDAAIRLDSTLADAHNLRGVILEELDRAEEAIMAYREALRLEPGFDAARENLAAAATELQIEESTSGLRTEAEATGWEKTTAQPVEEQILFEAENGDSAYAWLSGRVDLLPTAGAITVYEYPDEGLTITIPVSEITSCEIVEREAIPYLKRGWSDRETGSNLGCLLVAGFITLLDRAVSRAGVVPTIKLSQSTSDDSGQGWVLHLRSVKGGRRGRAATLEMAYHIVTFLRGAGYRGTVPEELSEPADLEAFVKEGSVSTDLELSLKRKWFAGGILASLFSYVTGLLVAGFLVEPWNLSVSEYLDILLDMYLGLSACCGLPGLALSLLVLGMAILRPKRPRRSAITVVVITFAVLNLAIGCLVGAFNMLDLSRY